MVFDLIFQNLFGLKPKPSGFLPQLLAKVDQTHFKIVKRGAALFRGVVDHRMDCRSGRAALLTQDICRLSGVGPIKDQTLDAPAKVLCERGLAGAGEPEQAEDLRTILVSKPRLYRHQDGILCQ